MITVWSRQKDFCADLRMCYKCMFYDRQQLIPFPKSMGHEHGYIQTYTKKLEFEKAFLGGKKSSVPVWLQLFESLLSLRAEIVTAGFSTFTVQLQQEVSKEGKI